MSITEKIALAAIAVSYLFFRGAIATLIRRKLSKAQDTIQLTPLERDHDALMQKLARDESSFLEDKKSYDESKKTIE